MMFLWLYGIVSVIEVAQIRRILHNCILMSTVTLYAIIIDWKIGGIHVTRGSLFVVISIWWILGKLEMDQSFAIELASVDTLLAGTNVNILVFEIKTGDVIYFSFDSLILRWKYHGSCEGSTLRACFSAIGNTSEHTIILLSLDEKILIILLKFNISYQKQSQKWA